MHRPLILGSAILLGAVAPASAGSIDAAWPVLVSRQDGDCALSIAGNGKIVRIAASGLAPGEGARIRLTNGDMAPIAWNHTADGDGRIVRYYLPFRFNRPGGLVDLTVAAGTCTLGGNFAWQRGIRVID